MKITKRIRAKPFRKKTYQKKKKVPLAIKTYVQKEIARDIENKSVQINGGANFGSYLEDLTLNAYPMLPYTGYWSVTQGVGAGNRIGNQIKTRKLMLNYVLFPLPYDATSNPNPIPCEVIMYLGYVKNTPAVLPGATDFTYFYQSGNSSVTPAGSLRDLIAVNNKDYWVIKKRWSHKIGFSNNQGTGGVANYQYQANNDFKLNVVRRLDITKLVPSTIIFNDTGSSPTTKNLFLMFEAVSSNGLVLGAAFKTVTIDYWIDFEYEDA